MGGDLNDIRSLRRNLRCVLLCAGKGARMAPFTNDKPKAFVPLQGTPLICIALETLSRASPHIVDFTIITGCLHDYWVGQLPKLQEICRPSCVTLVNNPRYETTGPAESLMLAEATWGDNAGVEDADICVVYGDVLFTETVVHRLFDAPSPAVALDRDFRRSKQDFNYNCIELVTLDDRGKVSTIGTKASSEFAFGEFMGLCVIPRIAISSYMLTSENATMAQFLQNLARHQSVSAAFFFGNWKEVNSYDDLLAAHADVYFLPNVAARKKYVQDIGRRLLSEANDIKRPLDLVAKEMGLDSSVIPRILDGRMDVDTAQGLLSKVCRHYPVAMSSLWVDPDDTLDGVLCTSAEVSEASGRVLSRPNREGVLSDYYEYRDTAMSRLAPFRPEWIRMIRTVYDDDPENPDVVYNKGHLLLQLTFFIGPVNFYYCKPDGTKVCAKMNTGDSNWIAPFVPHSFAKRGDGDELACIVACTYGSQIMPAMGTISRLQRALNVSTFESQLARLMEIEVMSKKHLESLVSQGVGDVLNGVRECAWDDARELATVLNCRPEDLMRTPVVPGEVVVERLSNDPRPYPVSCASGEVPAYLFRQCARYAQQPLMKAFDMEIVPPGGAIMDISLHQYLFNYSDEPCTLAWGDGMTQPLEPNASAYIQPTVRWRLYSHSPAHIFTVWIPGSLTTEMLWELGCCDRRGIDRVGCESTRWY
eukprot:GEMP01021137.1.p1 GENE.GEMP01021137.1~~GEMP01021137.1.p1  ORF type:complete len:704 (+),score=133.52 GEMP01021137.1:71-2182(+)